MSSQIQAPPAQTPTQTAPTQTPLQPAAGPLGAGRQGNLYRWFAILTVGGSSAGAVLALWQWWHGQVGVLEYTLLAVFYLLTALGIEAGFHRFFSHAAFSSGPRTTYLLGAMGSMAAEGPVLFWAATHRQHHVFTDQAGDPHSPHGHDGSWHGRVRHFIHAHIGWLFASQHSSWARFAPDLLRRRAIMTINQHYLLWVLLGLALPAAIAGVIGGSWAAAGNGLVWGGLLRIFLLHHVTWGVNSLAHCWGKRPYNTRDRSGNLAWLALPSVGGAWHNNHHAVPASARNDHQSPWQLDLSGWFIELLGVLGLAGDIKRPDTVKGRFTTGAGHRPGATPRSATHSATTATAQSTTPATVQSETSPTGPLAADPTLARSPE